jgi:hypothetical protein
MSDEIQKNISRLAFRHGITLGHLNETGGRELEYLLERFDAQAAEIERLRARVEHLEREMRFIGRLDYPPTRLSAQNRARAALTALRKLKP